MSVESAAEFIKDGMSVGLSGFTRAGDPKVIIKALADKVKATGEEMKINLLTGASVGEQIDGVLSDAGIVNKRLPYQAESHMRDSINKGNVLYLDQHLSDTAEFLLDGFLGKLDLAILEAVAITEDGGIILSTSVGNSSSFALLADKIIIELNLAQPRELEGIHDIYFIGKQPGRKPIPITKPEDRIGSKAVNINPDKIVGIVITNEEEQFASFTEPDEGTNKMAGYLLEILKQDVKKGRLSPKLTMQSGVGSVANAVLYGLADSPFDSLNFYSEVLQDAVFTLLDIGKMRFASATSMSLSVTNGSEILNNIGKYKDRMILRPQIISNHPEVIRRLGLITVNTAIEADIYGNVNSTHIMGTKMMNGIGGSADFAHNSLLSVFVTKSTAKNGAISSIVPFVSHVDHTEHDVDILITEQGIADLRGLSPRERPSQIIENCSHPMYKDCLRDYFKAAIKNGGHTPHNLSAALSWHMNYLERGSMLKTC
jgi:succinyl-CoA:acetate CoA-transferase